MRYLWIGEKIEINKLNRKKGQALILAYMALVFLAILSAPLFGKVITEKGALQRQRLETEAFSLAEGGIEEAINKFISAIANFQISANVARYPVAGVINTVYANSGAFPQGAQVNSYITSAGDPFNTTDEDNTPVIVKPYIVISTCRHPANNSIVVTVNQTILVKLTYAFQYAVFYNDDLELFPGKQMTFTGRIFSNKDIYLGSDGSTLKIDSEYLRSAGGIYNYRKDGSNKYDGTVNIKVAGTSHYVDMHNPPAPYPDPLDSTDPNWIADSQDAWKGTVQTSANATTKKAVPVVGSIQPGGYYNSHADIVVTNGTITQGGHTLTQAPDTGHNDPAIYDLPAGTITATTDNTFYNAREGSYVQMTTIDLSKLAGYINPTDRNPVFSNHLVSSNPQGALVYATVNNAADGQEPGVRLLNGSQISSVGLTVVTNDPLYIQGDYNTGNKPSSVICDSVNILSNSWQDGNSSKDISKRVANLSTTVNTAFISGVDTTTNGNYNGGLENYTRFLENWGNVDINITGSFVELWNTQIAHGAWNTPGAYSPPKNRNWSYNTNFTSGNMPPYTPWAVEAERTAWWK